MSTIAIVPARGGSKGIPGKNLTCVRGSTLVGRAVDVALQCSEIDEVIVSSDDPAILAEGSAWGATALRRPRALAEDDTPTAAVIEHALEQRPSARVVVVLQPTSPLRVPDDVHACLEALEPAPSATTVTPVEHPVGWSFRLDPSGSLIPCDAWEELEHRRQDAAVTYRLTGAVYAALAAHVRLGGALVGPGTVGIVTPRIRSVDIDDVFDLRVAEMLAVHGADMGTTHTTAVLFGGGGHGHAVIDILSRLNVQVVALVDPRVRDAPRGCELLTSDAEGVRRAREGHIGVAAVGDNVARAELVARLREAGLEIPPVVATTATVAEKASLGAGCIIMEHAHVGPGTRLGVAALVNTHAIVEHDTLIGDAAHIAPGAVLSGGVAVGDNALIGAGAVALPLARIGQNARVGAGAVVRGEIPAEATAVGAPARIVEKR